MSRILLPLAGLLLVFGPGVVLLGGGLTAGVSLFSSESGALDTRRVR